MLATLTKNSRHEANLFMRPFLTRICTMLPPVEIWEVHCKDFTWREVITFYQSKISKSFMLLPVLRSTIHTQVLLEVFKKMMPTTERMLPPGFHIILLQGWF